MGMSAPFVDVSSSLQGFTFLLGVYEPFNVVTKNALLHALAEQRIEASDEQVENLMRAYNTLAP